MVFETERLLMRPIEISDTERLFLMDKNPKVMKYIGISPFASIEKTQDLIQQILQQYQQYGIGRYAVIEKQSGLLIGWSGLKFNTERINEHHNFYEIGYRFMPEYWGKGFATESCIPFINYAFCDLQINKICAYVHEKNRDSQRVLEKLNFVKTSIFSEPDGLCYWYELKQSKYTLI